MMTIRSIRESHRDQPSINYVHANTRMTTPSTSTALFVPYLNPFQLKRTTMTSALTSNSPKSLHIHTKRIITSTAAAALLIFSPVTHVDAVSGGGKDYSGQNHAGEVFHGDFSGKDFAGGLFRNCDFVGANLTSARLFKAELREADLSHANLSFATIEAAILRDTVFEDARMTGTYISDSILEAASIKGADFSDALISPASVVSKLCARPDADGVNSETGVSTRESLMCSD